MAETESRKPVLGIFVHIEETPSRYNDDVCAWMRAHVVHVKDTWNQKFDFATCYGDIHEYADITLTELLSNRSTTGVGELRADPSTNNSLSEIGRIFNTMMKIDKRIAAMNKKFGRPVTFEQHVLRLANAVGAKWIITGKTAERAARSGYKYHFNELGHDYHYIQSDVEEWHKRHDKKTEGVTA